MSPFPRTFLTLALAVACCAAESFAEMEAKTDKTDPDALFQLAQWCEQNRQPSKARQIYNQIIKIAPDHDGARGALGMVKVGDRWVNKQFAQPGKPAAPASPETPAAPGETAPPPRLGGGGPSAAQVPWNLNPPHDPQAGVENDFVASYLARMDKATNDSNEMAGCVVTFLREDVWPTAFPRLCKHLLEAPSPDLYGPSEMIVELNKMGRRPEARQLYPFIIKGSERSRDPEDLAHLCMATMIIRERQAIPRLAELLGHADENVRDQAAEAAAAITFLFPAKELTAGKLTSWWNANWSIPEEQAWLNQLRSNDPVVVVAAAQGLMFKRNKAIFPALFQVMRGADPPNARQAVQVFRQATAMDWAGFDPVSPPADRAKAVELMERWWKDAQLRFDWPGLPKTEAAPGKPAETAPAKDPMAELVERLGATTGNESGEAEAELRRRGRQGVVALIAGLDNGTPLVRRRAHDLLKELTKQDFGFDPRADEGQRAAATAKWRGWAQQQGLLKEEPAKE